jgi:hypothetical protein
VIGPFQVFAAHMPSWCPKQIDEFEVDTATKENLVTNLEAESSKVESVRPAMKPRV